MKATFITILFFLQSIVALAQHKIEEFDILPGSTHSNPEELTEFNNKIYFYAGKETDSLGLYSYDSISGVSFVWSLSHNYRWYMSRSSMMTVADDKLYFAGSEESTGTELYVYDGEHTPRLVTDIITGPASSFPNDLTLLNDKLYFTTYEPGHPYGKLWLHDPATGATRWLDLPDTDIEVANDACARLTVFNDKLYFTGTSRKDSTGLELFAYAPSTGKTSLVTDICTGACSGTPAFLNLIDDKLYLTAYNITGNRQLFSYDEHKLERLTNLPDVKRSNWRLMKYYRRKIYFAANSGLSPKYFNNLYSYDLASGLIEEILSPEKKSFELGFDMIEYNGKLWFSAAAPGLLGETELWAYDGTHLPALTDLPSDEKGSWPYQFKVWQGSLFFSGNSSHGTELFKLTDTSKRPEVFHISLYPNPASGKAYLDISLENEDVLTIKLFDIAGREVMAQRGIEYSGGVLTIPLPLGHLSSGIYACSVANNKGQVVRTLRLVKM